MAAKFEIRSPKAGQYTWVLVSQGRTLATSQTYNRRALAEKAVVAFRMAATAAPVVDTTLPAAKTATSKTARAAGRMVAKAVVKGGRAVETVEQKAAEATKQATKTVSRAAKAATAKSAAPRNRSSRAR
jgi:uncharacterized protein YegP (UPF0339 family)